MDNIKLIRNGLRNLYALILNSKDKDIKELIDNDIRLKGVPYIKLVNKITDKSRYNVIRLYLREDDEDSIFVDLNWGFAEYTRAASKPRIAITHDQVISWINLDNIYVRLFLEKSPKFEDASNTRVLIDNMDDVVEMLANEADYFYIRCKEIRESCDYLNTHNSAYAIEESDSYCPI